MNQRGTSGGELAEASLYFAFASASEGGGGSIEQRGSARREDGAGESERAGAGAAGKVCGPFPNRRGRSLARPAKSGWNSWAVGPQWAAGFDLASLAAEAASAIIGAGKSCPSGTGPRPGRQGPYGARDRRR